MSELVLLRVLLLLSMALGPLATHWLLFSERSRLGVAAYVGALACGGAGLFGPAPILCVVWLSFSAASFALFLRSRASSLRTRGVLAACVPFLFSNIAAVWLVAGANDLHLLGYDTQFSYYAALHGNVLGWALIGALAVLANRDGPQRGVYVASVFVCLVSFLLIALGIDQLRALKPIGVVGLSIAIPAAQLVFLRSVWARRRASFALGLVSFAGLAFTMALAWRNELSMGELVSVATVRGMVSVHGALNALVVAPCFLFAVALDASSSRREAEEQPRLAPDGGLNG
jgi:hypothetical protein